MNKNILWNKVYGSLLAGVMGDAMGAPSEGMTYQEIEKEFGYINDFSGAGTDDSAIKLILCEAILNNNGYVTADEFADAFLNNKDNYYSLFYIPVRNMFHKLESKLSLPVYAGYGNMQSSSSAMSITPMGLINACNPRQAAQETYDVAGLIHAGDSTFCRDGACAIAAAVAEALSPDATVDSIVTASYQYLHKQSSIVMINKIKQVVALAYETKSYEQFRERFYQSFLQDIISDSRETVPCTIALFVLADGDPNKAMIYAANFGRDSDTIGTMIGGICGAFKGVDGLKKEWVQKLEATYGQRQENSKGVDIKATVPDHAQLADQLVDIILMKAEDTKACLNRIDALRQ